MIDPASPTTPDPDLLDAWRPAVQAYRREMQRSGDDGRARAAALDAYRAVRPDENPDAARWSVARAIYFAAARHPAWFYKGFRPVPP